MKKIKFVIGILFAIALVLGLSLPAAAQPTQEEVQAAIDAGVVWLADQQNEDGSWGIIPAPDVDPWEAVAVTALAVKKLEHHAVDPKWGLGLPSPFDEANPYKDHIEKGLAFLFENAYVMDIGDQPAGDPDTNGNGIGVYFQTGLEEYHRMYSTSCALMAISEAIDGVDRFVVGGSLDGMTYLEVAQDTVDYLCFGQDDAGPGQGGWGYYENYIWSDQSNSGYVVLALGFAEAAPPFGAGLTVPQFVKDELSIWIDHIQNPDGGSDYDEDHNWGSSILRTGNLVHQMAFVGDDETTPRVQDALDYMQSVWLLNYDPGWRGTPACYQATFTVMKGLTSLGLYHEFGDPAIAWQEDFETVLVDQQHEDGYWPNCCWSGPDNILSTIWALLTLQKVAPPPPIEVSKDYRYTNVCFERDNDGDGLFNEDPVAGIDNDGDGRVDEDEIDGIDNDQDGLVDEDSANDDGDFNEDGTPRINEDDVDCPDGTSEGDLLPQNADGEYMLEAVVHPKNSKVSSYNPGQYYAVSTVIVDYTADITIEEEWGPCEIGELNPKKGGGKVVIVMIGEDGKAYQILDAQDDAVTVDADNGAAWVELENVPAGTTILMYVKFKPAVKTWAGEVTCENFNRAWYGSIDDRPDPVQYESSALLRLVEKE